MDGATTRMTLLGVAGALVLSGCTQNPPTRSTGSSSGEVLTVSPSPTGSATVTPTPTTAATPASPTSASGPQTPSQAPAPVAPTLGPGNESRDVIVGVAAADRFAACAQEYQALAELALPGPTVTTVMIDGWAERFRRASQAAAEQDFEGAAVSCGATVASMRAALT